MATILGNERRPQFFRKWKTTSIFQEMEDNLNFRIWKIQYQLFLLANADSKFPIKNNLQLNESQPSLT
jgi:hypothetical protein